jgi:signal transduction histidine kinase
MNLSYIIGVTRMAVANHSNQRTQMERLIEVCRALGKTDDVEHLLQTIVTTACDLTSSKYSFIFVYEQETDLLKVATGPNNYRETLSRIRLPLEKSVEGYVYQKTKPVSMHNAHNDARICRDIERAIGFTTHSLLAVPLIFRGQTIGVLESVNKLDKAYYTEDDLTILDTLASQAAVATLSTLLFEETQRAYQDVQELEKMKTEFIAIASHELRTPLGLILGHATFLHELIKDEQQRHQLDIIIRNANRLKNIIEDLANANSTITGSARIHQQDFSINSLIQNIVLSYQETAELKKITLNAILPPSDVRVNGDEDKLGIAINALVNNALTFTNPKGQITVSVDPLPGYVQILVSDNGIGIPSKDISHVFDRFYQVSSHLTRRHGGMGLGLSVAKAMIEIHNGQIWVDSEEGKGSKFYILLPQNTSSVDQKSGVFRPE